MNFNDHSLMQWYRQSWLSSKSRNNEEEVEEEGEGEREPDID